MGDGERASLSPSFSPRISEGASASSAQSSLVGGLSTSLQAICNLFTCKNLTLEEYRALLTMTFVLNVVSLVVEILHMVAVFVDKSYLLASLCLVATLLTVVNCFLVVRLIVTPTTSTALASSAIILVIEVVYVIQYVMEADTLLTERSVIIVTSVLLLCHLCTAWLLYRYWEFAMYHYGDMQGLHTFVNNFPDSEIRSSDVMSQLRSPLVEENTQFNSLV